MYNLIFQLIEKRKKEITSTLKIKYWGLENDWGDDIAKDPIIQIYYNILEDNRSFNNVIGRQPEEHSAFGITLSLERWARVAHVNSDTFRQKVYRYKKSVQEILLSTVETLYKQ